MTMETTNEVKVIPEVELEQNIALISNPADDLVNAGDSNGVLSEHAEGIVGETKEDAENSYVFVSGNSDHGGVGDRSCPDPGDRECGVNALTREVDRDEKVVLAENPGKLNLPIEVEEDKEPEIIVPEVVKVEEPTIVSEDILEGTKVVLETEQEVKSAIDDAKLDSEVANRSAVSEDCLLSNADVESEVAIASVEIEKLGDIKNDSVQADEIELEARIGFVSIIEDPNASVEIEKLGDIKNDSVQADEIELEARIGFVSIIEDPNASVEIDKLGDIKNGSVQADEIKLEARIGFVSIIEDPNASVEIEKLGDIENDSVQADEIKLEARIGFVSIIEDPNIDTGRGGNSVIDEGMHTADISNGFDEDISNGFVSTVKDSKIETEKGGNSVKVEESVHTAPEELKFEKEISNGFVSTVEDPKKETEMASHSVKIEENMHTATEEHESEKEISNGSASAIEDPKIETEMGSEESIHAAAEEHKLQTENNNGFVSSVEDPKIETYLVGNDSVKLEESTDNVAEEKKSEKEISNGFFYTIDPMIESETGNGSVDFEESVPTAGEENQFEKEISVSDEINSTSCVSPVKNVKSAIEEANVSAGIECTLVEGNGSMGNGSLKLEESTDNVAEEKKSEKEISNGLFYTIEDPIIESETGNGSADFEESMPTAGEENQFEKEISDSDEINGISCLSPAKNVKSAIEDANVSAGIECTLVDGNGSMGNGESLLLSPVKVETGIEVSNGHVENDQSYPLPISSEADLESEDNSKCLPTCPVDLGSGAEARKVSVESHEEGFTGEVDDTKVESDASVVSIAEHEGQSAIREEDERLSAEDIEGNEGVPQNETTITSQVDSTCASSGAETVDVEMLKKLPNYIIRVPRYVDDELGAKIKQFQFEVDQKTQQRDSIRTALQAEKVTCAQFWDNVVAARSEERAAREAVNAKYREMDSVQLIINKMNNATSIEKINDRIDGMEHMIQHETMQLKEEKLLIREIKQLKQVREQLCANMGTPAELQEAFDQRNSIDERFKLLKQELDSLRSKLWHTESVTKAAKKKHSDECDNLKNLQIQFRNADSLRQQAYAELRSLKKQIYEKNKCFYMYKDDQKAAADLASAGDREALRRFCSDQVEKFMDLWNKNDEFRNQYVKHNVMSTVRRLRTLDGRSLGPDEEPPVILRHPVEKTDSSTLKTSAKINTAVIPGTLCAPATPEKGESKSVIEVGPNKLSAKSKKTTKSISAETVPTTVPSRVEEVDKESEKEQKPTKEPEELVNKEEELKKQEVAAMLREQRRLEEIAKAKEAAERKKRNAEKAQARAELRAKKEAELKEKEREKRAKKKEKKRDAQADSSSGSVDGDSAQVSSDKNASETAEEPESSTKEKPANVVRRYSKSMAATKSKPLPPLPLRNRGKRRMQAWMWWALFAAVLLVVMFLAVSGMFRISLSNLGF